MKANAAQIEARLRIDIEGKALRDAPGRLLDEAASLSLFGGARYIRLTGADDHVLPAVEMLLRAETAGNPVLALGPSLKTTSKLVKAAIAAPGALVHGCYLPDAAEGGRIAAAMGREAGVHLAPPAADALAAACQNDRAILFGEIEKIALYLDAAPDRPRDADLDTIDAIGAGLDESELFGAINFILAGNSEATGAELRRLAESGGAFIPFLRQLARRLVALAAMRVEVDQGSGVDKVIEQRRVFFREKAATAHALRSWSAPQLRRAIKQVRATERALMDSRNAGDVLATWNSARLSLRQR